jgi:hypothetical protein
MIYRTFETPYIKRVGSQRLKGALTVNPTFVRVDGPYPYQGHDGDEYPYWTVSLCNDDDEDLKTYEVRNFDRAFELGRKIAQDRRIELVNEGSPA